ncbi:DUF1493 family protein [Erwinia tracheiphila]|uniref:DUF1493 family protein n=1 Tax=Erwinia tracheiphila TaxID=65700 RepID=A0A0M2KEP6_9GAMM|nr:DUF1493 family protein [Erwinia tracheiphila]AXF75676.1 DUF1493 family protein [Erwinia tracheiphila]EOS93246.1 hypothetical protein ETR_20088 [Erwinia tracheiphila PSU-1]KKF35812.1 hypothetical protein SY86_10855 [Erwinia tracheiphila]UIA81776.1 DUF1493 family protein [Erwinia tracheiphila]UIA86083.1 DUF1493 family protein [Erwinia tracheiphila]
MELNDEQAMKVFDWYDEKWNLPPPFSKKRQLTLDTSLSTGDYPLAREIGGDIMEEYFAHFDVDNSNFAFLKYWPISKGFIPNFIRPKSMRVEEKNAEPLTIAMLIESAKAGRWLY